MSLIDDWIEEADQDLHIDYLGNIGEQLAYNHKHFTKWLSRLKKHSLELRKMRVKAEKLNSTLWIYYTGKASPDVYKAKPMDNRFLKSEVKEAISQDNEMMKLRLEISIQEEYVDTLERIVSEVKNRSYSFKNLIEWKKFESGI